MFKDDETDRQYNNDINNILNLFDLEPLEQEENDIITDSIILSVETDLKSSDTYDIQESNVNIINKDESVSKVLLFIMMSIIIVVVIIIATALDSPYEESHTFSNQETSTQVNSDSTIHAENYLTNQNVIMLLNEIDFDQASNSMSSGYTTNELMYLIDVFNKLNYEINKSRNDYLRLLIASTVHFQKNNDLQVDGMVGPRTLNELSKAIAIEQEENYIRDYIKTDTAIVKEYGWESQNVEKFVYFVSYNFDYDYIYDNGYTMYAFEVDIRNQTVVFIEGQLLEKYRRLGYVE